MAELVAVKSFSKRFIPYLPGSDIALALGVVLLLAIMIFPLPAYAVDIGLSFSFVSAVLILMVALFLKKPTDFTSFPTILLLATLLRLSLEIATTRRILTYGSQGLNAAGSVVAAFGTFLIGGNVVIGGIIFAILLTVNFMVITKGSTRISEVSARFILDSLPGKQMAVDADLASGALDDRTAKRRRDEIAQESSFYGAMDGASKFVRGDAVAAIVILAINIIGGLAVGIMQDGMSISGALHTFTTLTVGDGLVSQIPGLLVSTAAGIVITKGGEAGNNNAIIAQLGHGYKPLLLAAITAVLLGVMPGMPLMPFGIMAVGCGVGAWYRYKHPAPDPNAETEVVVDSVSLEEAPVTDRLKMDMIRLELGFSLLSLAGGENAGLTDQIKTLRHAIAEEMGFILPPVRIQDNMLLEPTEYRVMIKEIEAGRGKLRPTQLLAMPAGGELPTIKGEVTKEPAFGLPAVWIEESEREEALLLGMTVVDPGSVLATHLTEIIRDQMPDLLSFAETQKLLSGLPMEYHRLLSDMIPSQISAGSIQKILQALLAERVSIRDLPTILEGIQQAVNSGSKAFPFVLIHVRAGLARQLTHAYTGEDGFIPVLTFSPHWEETLRAALSGPPDAPELSLNQEQLSAFIQDFKKAIDSALSQGETPVVLTSGELRLPLRTIIERIRPSTAVMAQTEITPKAKIKTLGVI